MDEKEFKQSTAHENAASTTENTNKDMKNDNKSAGPAIGTIIVVIVLAFGGLYFWGQRIADQGDLDNTIPEAVEILESPDSVLRDLEEQGTSDEIEDIEADLNINLLEDLDVELDNIDAELNF